MASKLEEILFGLTSNKPKRVQSINKYSRFKFFTTGTNVDTGEFGPLLGKLTWKDFDWIDNITYVIPSYQQYRPDLIAAQFYGNEKCLFHVFITIANNFAKTPEEYVTGAEIIIPNKARLTAML